MTVKALNRYDCRNQTFATIKRVYLDADSTVVKDEKVKVEKDMPIAIGSVDEKLWRDVCKPAGGGAKTSLSWPECFKAAQAAQAGGKPEVRTADYRPPGAPRSRGDPGGGGQGRARRRAAHQEEFHRQAGAAAQGRAGPEKPARAEAPPPEVHRVPAYVPPPRRGRGWCAPAGEGRPCRPRPGRPARRWPTTRSTGATTGRARRPTGVP
jgi:carbonic anhydrase